MSITDQTGSETTVAPIAPTLLRLATAGSVDDGKSTLVGRLLHDTRSVLADQLADGWRILPITLGPQASCSTRFPRYGRSIDPVINASTTNGYAAAKAAAAKGDAKMKEIADDMSHAL